MSPHQAASQRSPDLIHVALWRNDGFLHSFCNFWKSNAFGENFIRTKFILYEIFFWMSILLRRKTSQDVLQWLLKKLRKTICGRTWPFWREEDVWHKNQYTFFVRNEVLNFFLYNSLSNKKNEQYFPKLTAKNYFWGAWPFFREWNVGEQKMNITFSWGVRYRIWLRKFCLKQPHTGWMNAKKPVLGTHFPHSGGSIGAIVSKINK